MLSGIPVWFSSNANQLWSVAGDGTFFLQLSDTCILWVFSIVHEASWESKMALEWRSASCDQKNVIFIRDLFGDDCIDSQVWDLVDLFWLGSLWKDFDLLQICLHFFAKVSN